MPYITLPRTGMQVAVGNLKVGKDTAIMNITSATDCESFKKGLCQVPPGKCYAMNSERQYPGCLPYRRRQTSIWDKSSAEDLALDLKDVLRKKRKVPIRYLRMQEAGDFRNQADVDKTVHLADLLRGAIRVYTYSARKDLRLPADSTNLAINGSNFKVSNDFKVTNKAGYEFCPKGRPSSFDCNKCESPCKSPRCRGIKGGGCLGCNLCKTGGGKTIRELLRVSGGTGSSDFTGKSDEHGGVSAESPAELKQESLLPGIQQSGKRKTKIVKCKSRPDILPGFRRIV